MSCKFKDLTKGDGIHPLCYVTQCECLFLVHPYDEACPILAAFIDLPGPIPPIEMHTVRFYANSVLLLTLQVEHNKSAIPPADIPEKEGYKFEGWDKPFDNITSDLNINAVYLLKYLTLVTNVKSLIKEHNFTLELTGTSLEYIHYDSTAITYTVLPPYDKIAELKTRTNVVEVKDPDGIIKSVYDYSFARCGNIQSVNLQTATRIGNNCFLTCTKLAKLVCPKLEQVDNYAFTLTVLSEIVLNDVDLPPELTTTTFYNCNCDKLTIYVKDENAITQFKNSKNWTARLPKVPIEYVVMPNN